MSDLGALEDLRLHWGDAYTIQHFDGQPWTAVPRDGAGEPLEAATQQELRIKIRADYFARTSPKPTDQGTL